MIYLIIFTFITFILAFVLKLLITYFFIKLFNKEKSFWLIFKPILLYELGVFCFFIINPVSLIYFLVPWYIIPHVFLFPVYFIISIIILFLIFKFIMKKFSLLDFKKALLVFFIMFIIITPIISFSKSMVDHEVAKRIPASEELFEELLELRYFQESYYGLDSGHYGLMSPDIIILKKIDRLSEIFLGSKLLLDLYSFLITITI